MRVQISTRLRVLQPYRLLTRNRLACSTQLVLLRRLLLRELRLLDRPERPYVLTLRVTRHNLLPAARAILHLLGKQVVLAALILQSDGGAAG